MLRFAFANLISRPARTLLATIGLAIAIAGMVGLFAIAGGIDRLLQSSLGAIPGILVLQSGAPVPLFSVLPAAWGEEIAGMEGVGVVNPEVWTRVNLLDGEPVLSPPRLLMGTDPDSRSRLKHGLFKECLEQGRFLDERDVGRSHVVISRQIAEQVGKRVGDSLAINGREMTIIGIYHCGSLIFDVTCIADIGVVRTMARLSPDTVSAFYVEPAGKIDNALIVQRIQAQFRGRETPPASPLGPFSQWMIPPLSAVDLVRWLLSRAAAPKAETESDLRPSETEKESTSAALNVQPLTVTPVSEFGERFAEMTGELDLVLALLTGVGVAIALSSIVNTMVMSVTERTLEFGILRANGWSQGHVVRLIISESGMVGLAGGIAGVLVGWAATQVVNLLWPDRIQLHAGPALLVGSLCFSVAVGVLGGLYPAIRAARMSPMAAIRRA